MEKKSSKSVNKAFIAAAVLIAAVAVLLLYFFVLRDTHKNDLQNTPADSATEESTVTEASDKDEVNAELKKLADEGRISEHINAVKPDIMKKMINDAQTLDYTEISEQKFSDDVFEYTGCRIAVTDEKLTEQTAEDSDFYYADACDEDNEAYLVFGKSDKNMYILIRPLNSDGYWICEMVSSKDIAERYSGALQSGSELHYISEDSGKTVFFGKTVDDIWSLYYNDEGDLFLCMDNTDIDNPKFYNGSFLEMESFAGRLSLQTVLDGITEKYGKALVF